MRLTMPSGRIIIGPVKKVVTGRIVMGQEISRPKGMHSDLEPVNIPKKLVKVVRDMPKEGDLVRCELPGGGEYLGKLVSVGKGTYTAKVQVFHEAKYESAHYKYVRESELITDLEELKKVLIKA